MSDLTSLRTADERETLFNLTEVLSSFWEHIGKELGMSLQLLTSMKAESKTDYERMEMIWKMWLEHNQDLSEIEKYPPTDVGLNSLLNAIDDKKFFIVSTNVGAQAAMKYLQLKSQQ